MNVCCITGHRPNRIPDMDMVEDSLYDAYENLDIEHVIQGMADGADLISARAAWDCRIGFSCARPWTNHAPGKHWVNLYEWALDRAENVWVVNDSLGYPGPQVYQERNEFMVDRAHLVIAVWDGTKKGGTWNTIKYALEEKRPIWRIDPRDGESGWHGE